MYHPISLQEKTYRTNTEMYIYTLTAQVNDEPIISHWHQEAEIIYCKCRGTAYIDDKSFCFKENDIILVNKNELHHIKVNSAGSLYCYLFDYKYLDFKLNDWCCTNIISPLDRSSLIFPQMIGTTHKLHKKTEALLCEILYWYNENLQGKQIKIKALLYELIFEMYSGQCFVTKNSDTIKSHAEYIKTIISYMNENINEDITLDDISRKLHLSKGYIINLFKSVTGQTPIVYLRNLRLEYASSLLKNGKSVTETTCLCGITNVSYFIREYKKKYGTTPKRHYS